jgi:hypothetical protein
MKTIMTIYPLITFSYTWYMWSKRVADFCLKVAGSNLSRTNKYTDIFKYTSSEFEDICWNCAWKLTTIRVFQTCRSYILLFFKSLSIFCYLCSVVRLRSDEGYIEHKNIPLQQKILPYFLKRSRVSCEQETGIMPDDCCSPIVIIVQSLATPYL